MTYHSQTLSTALSTLVEQGHPVSVAPKDVWLPYEALADDLFEKFGQFPVVDGVAEDGHMLEVFSSVKPGEWTIVMKMDNGMACEVAKSRTCVSTVTPLAPSGA